MRPHGTCTEMKILHPAIGSVHCDREAAHPGYHFDKSEHMYWFPGAPKLETFVFAGKESDR